MVNFLNFQNRPKVIMGWFFLMYLALAVRLVTYNSLYVPVLKVCVILARPNHHLIRGY